MLAQAGLFLDAALWNRLTEAPGAREAARAWLALQIQQIEAASHGLVLLSGKERNSFESIAVWPEGGGHSTPLAEIAELALRERRGVASGDGSIKTVDPAGTARIAFPILMGAELRGAVAVTIQGSRPDQVRTAMRQLQWGVAWLRDRLRESIVAERDGLLERSRAALELMAGALDHEGFHAAAMSTVTSLAVRCGCARVSLGVRERHHTDVKIISHTAQFGQQMNLVSALGAAMDEALDQRCIVFFPATPNQMLATSAHEELSRSQRDARVLSVPLLVGDRFTGAMTFEWPADVAVSTQTIEMIELVTSVIGPVLEEKRRNDRWLIFKIGESLRRQAVRLLGPGHLARKAAAIAILAAAAYFSVAEGPFRVSADAQIEGLVRRAIVAPYDGFIKDASARAGDKVAEGDLMASLEDRDLLLERLKWVTERQQHLYEYDKALAARQPAAINVIRSQIDQADAQIKLLDEQIGRVKLRSPISGLVVSGDLSQLIGASVQRGQVLFEVAPLDSYRVILDVDEREVGVVDPGQTGELIITALPNESLAFVVDKITPLAEARSGRNVFRVEGKLSGDPSRLRPGMEGIGKIDIGRRNQAWIWLHPLIDWLRIWAWRWQP